MTDTNANNLTQAFPQQFVTLRWNIGYDGDGNQVAMFNGQVVGRTEPSRDLTTDHWFKIWEAINNDRSQQETAQ